MESQHHPGIDGKPVPDHFASILLIVWSSRVVPRCQNGPLGCSRVANMVLQGAKMETPSLVKGTFSDLNEELFAFNNNEKHTPNLELKKLTYTPNEITPKSMKMLFGTTSCPSRCSQRPGWSQGGLEPHLP